ncbi:MAG: cell division protein ZapA [Acidobacteriota bacterium]|nr:cell division protein ZapA [Acidobacteriota bacterium]
MSQQFDAEQPQQPVTVTIFDQPYRLRVSSGGDEHVRRVAGLVDERMREVAAHMRSLDVTRIAVLAALNLADELESLRAEQSRAAEATMHETADDATNGDAESDAPTDPRAADARTNARDAVAARRSWFEEIFEAEDDRAARDSERRLSTEISAKLRPRRRD